MNNSIDILCKKFKRIKDEGYIQSKYGGFGGGGLTFEKLVGATAENFEYPDFEGIELKTRCKFSKYPIGLFCANPDGEYLFEVERLKDKYGYPDKQDKNYRAFSCSVSANRLSALGYYTKFMLNVDKEKEKIFLCVFKNDILVEKQVFWSFELLKEKLYRKFQTLALVTTLREREMLESTIRYSYKYSKMEIYKLKNFDAFINLVEAGKISILFNVGIYHSGEKYGKTYNHGVKFEIQYNDLESLFVKIREVS